MLHMRRNPRCGRWLMAGLVLATAGCSSSQGTSGRARADTGNRNLSSPRGGGGAVDSRRDPNELVAEAVNRQAVLTSLAGDGVLAMIDPAAGMNHRVNAEVVAADGRRLRISGGRMSVHAFDLMMYGDDVVFHDALKKRVYEGQVADLGQLGLPISPDQVLNQLLKPATELAYLRWSADRQRTGDVQGTLAYVANEGGTVHRVLLDRRSGLVSRIETFHGPVDGGTPYMSRTFGQYRPVTKERGNRRNAPEMVSVPVFPYVQRIEWPREKRRVEFTFKRVVPDAPLAVDDFNVPYSSRAQRLPLRQAGFDPAAFDEVSMR